MNSALEKQPLCACTAAVVLDLQDWNLEAFTLLQDFAVLAEVVCGSEKFGELDEHLLMTNDH